jgi:hypothetical protein
MIRYRRFFAVALIFGLATVVTVTGASKDEKEQRERLEFAARMAKKGNWGEAQYRWQKASAADPDNPFILNNLAVALEATGKHVEAQRRYAQAVSLSRGDSVIRENARRFEYLMKSLTVGNGSDATEPPAPIPASGDSNKPPKPPREFNVVIQVPLPPKLDISGMSNILMASVLTEDHELQDINREIVRYLRGELRRETSLAVLDVVPPPAIPEQGLEDLVANTEFWKKLGRQYGADLILSGRIEFDRDDISSFQNVDSVSNVTGQKVRRTEFVELEEFRYEMTVLFIDGKTGELLFRDEVSRKVTYRGMGNDSLTAFFAMSDAIVGDILAVVTSRMTHEQRAVFNG